MDIDCIPFRQTGYFSDLISDYIEGKENLKPFYNRFPKLENFKDQMAENRTIFRKKTGPFCMMRY